MNYELPRSTPEAQGVSSEVMTDVLKSLNEFEYLKGIIFLRHGHIIAESFWNPYDPEVPTALWSLSKSFTSCAVGLAQAEKRLSIKDKLIDFFPEYRSFVTDDKMFKVTLQDLLTMRSGHPQCAFSYARADIANDWVRGFLSSPLKFEPGTHFAYNSLGTYMLSAVVRRVTGMNVREYLKPRLFNPLGIVPGKWECCPAGTNCGGFGLYLRTADIARFAQLILNKGEWQGKQLLPADYLAEALTPHADNSMNDLPDWKAGYGYQFWRSRHGFRGDGACGQYGIILPEEDMAIAVTASMGAMGKVLDLLWEKLLPALKDEPLKEISKGALSNSFEIAPAENKVSAPCKNCSMELLPNSAGIEKISLVSGSDACTVSFKTARGVEEIRAGYGKFVRTSLQLQDTAVHPLSACAAWKDENTLEIRLFYIDSTFRDTWTFEFKGKSTEIRWQSVCSLFRPQLPPLTVKHFISE